MKSNLMLERMRHRRGLMVTAGVLGAAVLIPALGSCGPGGQGGYLRGWNPGTNPSAMHAVHNQRLHDILDQFESGAPPDPSELPAERRRCAGQLVDTASAMAASTRNIPDAMGDINLSADNREMFLSLKDKLCQQATNVSRLAGRQALGEVRSSFNEMQSTCKACHSLFTSKRPGA